MAGVLDEHGQWEHCNVCGDFVLIQNLGYNPPSDAHPHGQDICMACTNKLPQDDMVKVIPAESWIPQYDEEI